MNTNQAYPDTDAHASTMTAAEYIARLDERLNRLRAAGRAGTFEYEHVSWERDAAAERDA